MFLLLSNMTTVWAMEEIKVSYYLAIETGLRPVEKS